MGAPKQKWTEEEEYALKAGVTKHGAGKWCTILKDPEFSCILHLRSNVDLKDKWRNLGSTASGCGTREKARLALKKGHHVVKHDDNSMASSTEVMYFGNEIIDAKPLAISSDVLHVIGPKVSFSRLDNLIFEAISCLKEPIGSNKTTIAEYIEDHYGSPINLKEFLSAKLNDLTASGKLIKVKHNYRIAPMPDFPKGRNSKAFLLEGRQREHNKVERNDFKPLKSQVDADLSRIKNMTAEEAAAVAAQLIAEAEAAIEEAEEAAREKEAAEADAEAARAFANVAMSVLKNRNAAKVIVRV